jgi:hypothetical protein
MSKAARQSSQKEGLRIWVKSSESREAATARCIMLLDGGAETEPLISEGLADFIMNFACHLLFIFFAVDH